jgi:hypothetical protein
LWCSLRAKGPGRRLLRRRSAVQEVEETRSAGREGSRYPSGSVKRVELGSASARSLEFKTRRLPKLVVLITGKGAGKKAFEEEVAATSTVGLAEL